MRVRVRYARQSDTGYDQTVDMLNVYDPLKLSVEGDVQTVANWLDEHVVAGSSAIAGHGQYKQGEMTPNIVKDLERGGKLDYGNGGLLWAEHI